MKRELRRMSQILKDQGTSLQKYIQLSKKNEPENLLRVATDLIYADVSSSKGGSCLGSEKWSILERILLLSGTYRLSDWMLYSFTLLKSSFPLSSRLQRALGLIRECLGDWKEGTNIYIKMLHDQPDDIATRKRIITLLLSSGNCHGAVDYLNKHLSEFVTDISSWHQLAEIYISEEYYRQSLFCFEELLINDPNNIYYVISYAELLSSIGDYSSAVEYFCLAINIYPESVRALWGIIRVYSSLPPSDRRPPSSKSKNSSLCRPSSSLSQISSSSSQKDTSSLSFSLSRTRHRGSAPGTAFEECPNNYLLNLKETSLKDSSQNAKMGTEKIEEGVEMDGLIPRAFLEGVVKRLRGIYMDIKNECGGHGNSSERMLADGVYSEFLDACIELCDEHLEN